mmetsp:Transcript_12421/g.36601  ORF Transcript_12421/g.36601 Transcript_12421/m.36601 type:complete len:211 (+) Transcript_12421:1152-1784(+)
MHHRDAIFCAIRRAAAPLQRRVQRRHGLHVFPLVRLEFVHPPPLLRRRSVPSAVPREQEQQDDDGDDRHHPHQDQEERHLLPHLDVPSHTLPSFLFPSRPPRSVEHLRSDENVRGAEYDRVSVRGLDEGRGIGGGGYVRRSDHRKIRPSRAREIVVREAKRGRGKGEGAEGAGGPGRGRPGRVPAGTGAQPRPWPRLCLLRRDAHQPLQG